MSQEKTNLESSMTSMTVKDSTKFSLASSTPFTGSTSNIPQGTVIYMAPEQMQARE
jgi:serine/threonine protein kinase